MGPDGYCIPTEDDEQQCPQGQIKTDSGDCIDDPRLEEDIVEEDTAEDYDCEDEALSLIATGMSPEKAYGIACGYTIPGKGSKGQRTGTTL